MKLTYTPLFAFLLIAVVFISGCISKTSKIPDTSRMLEKTPKIQPFKPYNESERIYPGCPSEELID